MQTRSDAQGNEGGHTPVLVPLPPAALPHIGVTHMPVTSEQASLLGQSPPEQAVAIEGTTHCPVTSVVPGPQALPLPLLNSVERDGMHDPYASCSC